MFETVVVAPVDLDQADLDALPDGVDPADVAVELSPRAARRLGRMLVGLEAEQVAEDAARLADQ
jgi:hypothetical protein